jgi:hypothetical protein
MSDIVKDGLISGLECYKIQQRVLVTILRRFLACPPYIDLLDEDDESDSLATPLARAQGFKNRRRSPAKQPHIEIDLT